MVISGGHSLKNVLKHPQYRRPRFASDDLRAKMKLSSHLMGKLETMTNTRKKLMESSQQKSRMINFQKTTITTTATTVPSNKLGTSNSTTATASPIGISHHKRNISDGSFRQYSNSTRNFNKIELGHKRLAPFRLKGSLSGESFNGGEKVDEQQQQRQQHQQQQQQQQHHRNSNTKPPDDSKDGTRTPTQMLSSNYEDFVDEDTKTDITESINFKQLNNNNLFLPPPTLPLLSNETYSSFASLNNSEIPNNNSRSTFPSKCVRLGPTVLKFYGDVGQLDSITRYSTALLDVKPGLTRIAQLDNIHKFEWKFSSLAEHDREAIVYMIRAELEVLSKSWESSIVNIGKLDSIISERISEYEILVVRSRRRKSVSKGILPITSKNAEE
eukprot:TRINITY_DN1237_c1_g2_i1.p1 TRINITY_DN1237_c1_g2~~TRINITY_DN1237_c1_g2_i1.p1  ORF type:complete len:385 (+),score=115.10 TRINITY_DN1237_c1_g2_i1:878-2032(+)